MRKSLLAIAMIMLVLLVLALTISGLTTVLLSHEKKLDRSGSEARSEIAPEGICALCKCTMKHCDPPSEYEWICHNCGYHVMRS